MIYAGGLTLGATMNVLAKKHWQKILHGSTNAQEKNMKGLEFRIAYTFKY
jgi:hypothetical protein